MKSIRRYCEAIAREFQPQRIVLFGSHAGGKPHRDSDVDVLVIMNSRPALGPRPALTIRQRLPAGFPLDLIVRAPEEIKQRILLGDSFLREITEKGRVMYETADA
jgi:uncharacterized protein